MKRKVLCLLMVGVFGMIQPVMRSIASKNSKKSFTKTPAKAVPNIILNAHRIEWLPKKNVCIATKEVVVTRDGVRLSGDTLNLFFHQEGKHRRLTHLTVVGHSCMKSPTATLTGQKFLYTVPEETLEVTGESPCLQTSDCKLQADSIIRYFKKEHRGEAHGGVVFTQGAYILTAQRMTAFFKPSSTGKASGLGLEGKLSLQRVEAEGGISWVLEDQKVTATRGIYVAKTECIHLWGNVRVRQGDNFIMGDHGIVNVRTKQARLSSSASKPVRALWTPPKKSRDASRSGKAPKPGKFEKPKVSLLVPKDPIFFRREACS